MLKFIFKEVLLILKFGLKKFMDDRHLSIQDVSDNTGISRNTISQLYNDKSKGVQFDTLNKLLNGLDAEIYDLFYEDVDLREMLFETEFAEDDVLDLKNKTGKYLDEEFANISFFSTNKFIKNGYKIREFEIPLQVSLEKTNSISALFFYSSDDFFGETDMSDHLNEVSDFLRQTDLKSLESLFFNIIIDALKHIDLKGLKIDYLYYVTDIGLVNLDRSPYVLCFSWPFDFAADHNKFNDYLSIKYN